MSNERYAKNVDRRPEDCPAAWFVVLERARWTHNFERAVQAKRELERLGVKVTYFQPRTSRQLGGARRKGRVARRG